MSEFSHIDEHGKANMVDVGKKSIQQRTAKAAGRIILKPETIEQIQQNQLKKGDVLSIAQIAGIQAAKRTADLIPLCHTLLLTKIDINTTIIEDGVLVESTVKCNGQTGVEMEALTAVSTSLLTIYDMCKAIDKTMVLTDIILIEKQKI